MLYYNNMSKSNEFNNKLLETFRVQLSYGFPESFRRYESILSETYLWEITINDERDWQSFLDRPAIIARDLKEPDKILFRAWCDNGKLSRVNDMPAVTLTDGESYLEEWWQNGLVHRDEINGAAEIEIDIEKDIVTWEKWCQNGKPGRTSGSYLTRRAPETGEIESEYYTTINKEELTP